MRPDPVDLLRRVDGLAGFERSSTPADVLLARVKAGVWQPVGARRRWRLWLGLFAVVAVPAGAAYAVWPTSVATDALTASCYSDASLHPREQVVIRMPDDPVGSCRREWEAGSFDTDGLPVPASLTACVSPAGVAAVVPGAGDVCEQMGLAPWAATAPNELEPNVRALQDQLVAMFTERCVPAHEAVAAAREVLSENGVEGWEVRSNRNWSTSAPCTGTELDAANRLVTVGGRPPFSDMEEP